MKMLVTWSHVRLGGALRRFSAMRADCIVEGFDALGKECYR